MVHATKFLLRWLYLNNLIYDRAEIQSLPFLHPSQVDPHNIRHTQQQQQGQQQQHQQQQHQQHQQQQQQIQSQQPPPPPPPPHPQQQYSLGGQQQQQYHNPIRSNINNNKGIDNDQEWKKQTLRTIALYPPGTARLLALDSLRLEIVHALATELHVADGIIQSYNRNCQLKKKKFLDGHTSHNDANTIDTVGVNAKRDANWGKEDLDLNLNKDDTIMKEFQKATSLHIIDEEEEDEDDNSTTQQQIVNSNNNNPSLTSSSSSSTTSIPSPNILSPKLKQALELQRETREYLPQFVSAILHSPPPLTSSFSHYNHNHHHLDPISTLRKLLLNRCIRDPNLGIELCWLLEAEVGRTWKSLFEHRQQTGKRLIIFLPADKAVVMAKIGSEKRSAFDLLQDAESATAYGVYEHEHEHEHDDSRGRGTRSSGDDSYHNLDPYHQASGVTNTATNSDKIYTTPRLPAALSMKRCSHFGDTMHFIDRLTQISLDLRMVPVVRRKEYLEESLEELNRRIRRRMVTEGNVSLDVDDNLGPYDWPSLGDISFESLKYSVHFPLEPTSTTWPGKHGPEVFQESSPLLALKTEHGVMRVLNIVSPKCQILASRERCPFLVHCEVLESGLEGRDARLYANGADEIGITLQEAMGIASEKKDANGGETRTGDDAYGNFPPHHIPSEILSMDEESTNSADTFQQQNHMMADGPSDHKTANFLIRGGEQEGNTYPNLDGSGYHSSTPYDVVQEERLQQLHEHLQSHQQHPHYGPQQSSSMSYSSEQRPTLTTYSSLLDRVYGSPWAETCEQIRKTSPYGNVKGWRLASFIMKAGEDIRREALVMQVISKMKYWFEQDIPEHNRPYLKPYTIMCVGGDAGLLECIREAKSIDEVKKNTDGFTTLREYFERAYGQPMKRGRGIHQPTQYPPHHPSFAAQQQNMQYQQPNQHPNLHHTMNQQQQQQQQHQQPIPNISGQDSINQGISFETAQDNFLRSLVGYSLICYILQIKDRHNANILLDRHGHIMHIDFGFVLGDTPKMGKVPLFSERAPFKLTAEFWDVIGGWNFNDGGLGVKFLKMFEEAFYCAAMHAEELVTLIESAILNLTQNPNVARIVANGVRNRLRMRGGKDSVEQKTFVMDLVNTALTSWGTSTYDWLQKSMNGYI